MKSSFECDKQESDRAEDIFQLCWRPWKILSLAFTTKIKNYDWCFEVFSNKQKWNCWRSFLLRSRFSRHFSKINIGTTSLINWVFVSLRKIMLDSLDAERNQNARWLCGVRGKLSLLELRQIIRHKSSSFSSLLPPRSRRRMFHFCFDWGKFEIDNSFSPKRKSRLCKIAFLNSQKYLGKLQENSVFQFTSTTHLKLLSFFVKYFCTLHSL